MLAMVVTALLFDPSANGSRSASTKFFYRTRYDYRKTLIEFGRRAELRNRSRPDAEFGGRSPLADLAGGSHGHLPGCGEAAAILLAKSFGMTQTSGLDLNFLSRSAAGNRGGHLFLGERPPGPARDRQRAAVDRQARSQLLHSLPRPATHDCISRLGKTVEGDFLTSEDIELLETLAGYIGIAIQNARLYASLEQKVAEYERLKDFNENIVESINVGVMAVDLEDRVESWNSQMEVMYALPRWQALTRR